MEIKKDSILAKLLLDAVAKDDSELQEAIKNGEINGIEIVGISTEEKDPKSLLDYFIDGTDADSDDDTEETATQQDDAERDYADVIEGLTEMLDDPNLPEKVAAPIRVVLASSTLMEILNPIPDKLSPIVPFTASRARMMKSLENAIHRATHEIIMEMRPYPEFKDILEKHHF